MRKFLPPSMALASDADIEEIYETMKTQDYFR
jgi:hypothetical protein